MGERSIPTPKKRRGTESRQRRKKIQVRVTDAEHAVLLAKAQAAGVTAGGFLRAAGFGKATPHTKRRAPVDRAAFAEVTRELRRVGTNINQIARVLNRGEGIAPPMLHDALAALAQVLRQVLHVATGSANDN